MGDAATWTGGKGWGSKHNYAYEDWSHIDTSDLEDDEEVKRELALDEAEDRKL
jgi:hypothetical protein